MTASTTAAPPQQPAEVARARVAVLVATYQVDVVLPTKFTIETFIGDLLTVLDGAIGDEAIDFTPENGQWTLARPGEPPIPRWRSLGDHDISDGALLMLTVVESSEIFTPVVEDITDALALINEREFAEFDADTAELAGITALGAGALSVAALLSWSWTRTGSVLWCALPALLLGAACGIAALVNHRRRAPARIGLGLALAALPLLFAGAAMLVPPAYGRPGPFAAANFAAGSVTLATAATAMLRLTRAGIAALIALTALGSAVAVAAIAATYLDLSVRQVAGGGVFAGLVLLTAAPRLAVLAAGIRPLDLPDPGSEVAPDTLADIFDAESSRTAGDEEFEAGRWDGSTGIEARARLAVTSLRGLIVAVSVLLAGSAVVAAGVSPGGVREMVLGAAVAGLLVLRSRWYPDRLQAITLIAASAVTVIGIGFVLAGAYATAPARVAVALVVAAAAATACVAAQRLPGVRLSPVTRRIIDLIEYALILAVPVIACWIMGIYTAMRRI
ncbi:type VII secretion integral membrane protein EccD [Nocardia sp. NPDC006630]|uniref:type VII secretion integral membrane protein EccD n=1 Tax=Nocardia sp. NPDC006630 TaxID=3157181 RepID=UPI0033AD5219